MMYASEFRHALKRLAAQYGMQDYAMGASVNAPKDDVELYFCCIITPRLDPNLDGSGPSAEVALLQLEAELMLRYTKVNEQPAL